MTTAIHSIQPGLSSNPGNCAFTLKTPQEIKNPMHATCCNAVFEKASINKFMSTPRECTECTNMRSQAGKGSFKSRTFSCNHTRNNPLLNTTVPCPGCRAPLETPAAPLFTRKVKTLVLDQATRLARQLAR